jgi:FkbM family methyltransferase|tara:strand:- start:9 stop:743 length:735 start_codon:yes stop_codon:yes gene_type:complete
MGEVEYKNNLERTLEYFRHFDRKGLLKKLVNKDEPVILDIGASVGQTLKEFKEIWPNSYVHCFEPLVESYNELVKNNFKRVKYNNFALGNENSMRKKFYYHKVQPMLSGFEKINKRSKDSIAINNPSMAGISKGEFVKNINDEITVEVKTLDDCWFSGDIDIIKLDAQGGESKIFEGAQETLKRTKVVLTELHFYDLYENKKSFSDIEKYLHPAGFRLYDISHISKNPMNGRTDWVDVIYTKEK